MGFSTLAAVGLIRRFGRDFNSRAALFGSLRFSEFSPIECPTEILPVNLGRRKTRRSRVHFTHTEGRYYCDWVVQQCRVYIPGPSSTTSAQTLGRNGHSWHSEGRRGWTDGRTDGLWLCLSSHIRRATIVLPIIYCRRRRRRRPLRAEQINSGFGFLYGR